MKKQPKWAEWGSKSITLNIRVDEGTKAELDKIATKEGDSVSNVARVALTYFIAKYKKGEIE